MSAAPLRRAIVVAAILFAGPPFQSCNPTRGERDLFYADLRDAVVQASKEVEREDAWKVSDRFREKMWPRLNAVANPSSLWPEYRRATAWLRFYEAMERRCGRNGPGKETGLNDLFLDVASLWPDAPDECRRLRGFAALLGAAVLEMVAALPHKLRLSENIHRRISKAVSDPDCLVRASYLFVFEDELKAVRKARVLLGDAETFECGCSFVDFLEPGDLFAVLEGVGTVLEGAKEKDDKGRREMSMLIRHLGPLVRQEPDAVRKNLQAYYFSGGRRGEQALVLLAVLDSLWDGKFWEEVALKGVSSDARSLALVVLARRGDEGLPHLKGILEAARPYGGEKETTTISPH